MGGETEFVFDLNRALSSRPSRGQIQTRYLRGFNALVYDLGANPRSLLELHDIDPATFVDPENQVDCMAAATMVEDCGSRLNDPMFGLRLADLQGPDVFGPVAALARAAPTFRDGLQCLIDYLPVFHSPEGIVESLETSDTVEIRWAANGDLDLIQQPKLHGFMLMLKTLRMLAGADFRPLRLRLAFQLRGPGVEALQDRAGCRVLRSDANAIVLPSAVLNRPIASSNSLVYDLLGRYLARAGGAAAPGLAVQVESYVRTAISSGACSIERCAASLGTSARSLQKGLLRLGRSFSGIVEAQRLALAQEALRDGRRTLDEIALALGYSDQTCFGRAFKRWTGVTPQSFREATTSCAAG